MMRSELAWTIKSPVDFREAQSFQFYKSTALSGLDHRLEEATGTELW